MIYPLNHLRVVKDFVVDLSHLFAQYQVIEPWLKSKSPAPEKERLPVGRRLPPPRRILRVHPLLLLYGGMSEPLVERRSIPGPRCAPPGVSMDQRQSR